MLPYFPCLPIDVACDCSLCRYPGNNGGAYEILKFGERSFIHVGKGFILVLFGAVFEIIVPFGPRGKQRRAFRSLGSDRMSNS